MAKIILDHEFYCTKCGNKSSFSIPRVKGKERPAGHLKKIFCLHCKKEVNMVECIPWSKYDYPDFELEFNYGNFDENGLRKQSYGDFKTMIYNKINKGEIE